MTDDLALFKKFADEARAKPSFGAGFFSHNYKSGNWELGKDKTISNGRQLGADCADVMFGYSKYDDATKRTDYRLVRIADGVPQPKREECGDRNKNLWVGENDPWVFVRVLPLFDPETHEVFVYVAKAFNGAAIGAVVDTWIHNRKAHPEDIDKVPLIALASDGYTKGDGTKNYNPLLELVGFIERPPGVRHIKPPALPTPPTPPAKKNGGNGGGTDMDDEIPF